MLRFSRNVDVLASWRFSTLLNASLRIRDCSSMYSRERVEFDSRLCSRLLTDLKKDSCVVGFGAVGLVNDDDDVVVVVEVVDDVLVAVVVALDSRVDVCSSFAVAVAVVVVVATLLLMQPPWDPTVAGKRRKKTPPLGRLCCFRFSSTWLRAALVDLTIDCSTAFDLLLTHERQHTVCL